MSALLELADRVERYVAKGHYDLDRDTERGLNEAIGLAIGVGHRIRVGDPALGNDRWVPSPLKPYVTSLDAAMTLVPEGWFIGSVAQPDPAQCATHAYAAVVQNEMREIDRGYGQPPDEDREVLESYAATPALALCAAALRAKAVGEGVE
jgi:hypothetical protein